MLTPYLVPQSALQRAWGIIWRPQQGALSAIADLASFVAVVAACMFMVVALLLTVLVYGERLLNAASMLRCCHVNIASGLL